MTPTTRESIRSEKRAAYDFFEGSEKRAAYDLFEGSELHLGGCPPIPEGWDWTRTTREVEAALPEARAELYDHWADWYASADGEPLDHARGRLFLRPHSPGRRLELQAEVPWVEDRERDYTDSQRGKAFSAVLLTDVDFPAGEGEGPGWHGRGYRAFLNPDGSQPEVQDRERVGYLVPHDVERVVLRSPDPSAVVEWGGTTLSGPGFRRGELTVPWDAWDDEKARCVVFVTTCDPEALVAAGGSFYPDPLSEEAECLGLAPRYRRR